MSNTFRGIKPIGNTVKKGDKKRSNNNNMEALSTYRGNIRPTHRKVH